MLEGVDDFGLTPVEIVAAELELTPDPAKAKEGKLRDLLSTTPARPAVIARSQQILKEAAKSRPIDVIAEAVNAEPGEVKAVLEAVSEMQRSERKELASFAADLNSVFNFDVALQELFEDIKKTRKMIDPDSEAGLGYTGEQRQLLKLAIAYTKDAKFIEALKKDHEEEIQMFLEELETLEPAMAARLFKKIDERRKQKRRLS
jgi:hypothetical protein